MIINRIYVCFSHHDRQLREAFAQDAAENLLRTLFAFVVSDVGKRNLSGKRGKVVIFKVPCDVDVGTGSNSVTGKECTASAAKSHAAHRLFPVARVADRFCAEHGLKPFQQLPDGGRLNFAHEPL